MQVSQGVEWALHTCVLLSQAPDGVSTPRRTIAEYYALPEPYLAKYLQRLVASGVLHATTGPHGGYRLARPAAEISALAVFEAIEGSAPAFRCMEIRRQGLSAATPEECRRTCSVKRLMDEADNAWRDRLARTSVADITGLLPATVTERTARTLNW